MAIQGIIRPPPEIRAVADKTASFVAKNGRGFETRIMNSAKGKTPKFAFLHDSSPFHAYYEDRIVFYADGGVDEKKDEEKEQKTDPAEKATEGAADADANANANADADVNTNANIIGKADKEATSSEKTHVKKQETLTTRKTKSIVDPVARALLAQRSRIQKALDLSTEKESKDQDESKEQHQPEKETLIPPSQKYTVLVPPKIITHAQLEIIKLTAQFVALNGKGGSFLRELTVREWNSPTWGFLQPRHANYAYFTQLVDLYRRLLQEAVLIHEKETKKKTEDNAHKSSILELATLKKMVGIDADVEEKGEITEQIQLIDSTAGNMSQCLDHAAFNAEYERYYEEKRRKELENMEGGSGGIGGAARVDWHDFVVVETIEFHVDESVESLPPPPPPAPKIEEPAPAKAGGHDVMDESSDEEDDGEKIQVVENYAPKVVSSKSQFASEARTHVIDPITKKSVRIDDMTEHMRIQLLDPKWAAEKAKFLENQKDSNLVDGDAIARNMETFAKARTDLFGASDLENNEESRRRLEASRAAHAQPQMPQPRPSSAAVAPPLPAANHHRPEAALPVPKRARMESTQPPYGAAPLPPPAVHVVPLIPPMGATVLPGSNPEPEMDTITLPTTLSEADFAKSLPDANISINIQVPSDPNQASWNLNGQTISITIDVMTKVKAIKQQIQAQLGSMPVNKMQLKNSSVGFLKDNLSLAFLNIGPNNDCLELLPKVRGGRR